MWTRASLPALRERSSRIAPTARNIVGQGFSADPRCDEVRKSWVTVQLQDASAESATPSEPEAIEIVHHGQSEYTNLSNHPILGIHKTFVAFPQRGDIVSRKFAQTAFEGDPTYAYDALSRITGISHVGPGGNAQYTYTYDPAGNRATAGYQDTINLIGSAYNEHYNYTYDAINQLTTTGYTTVSLGSGTRNYTYDAVGNRTSGVPANAFDASNHLTLLANGGSITYDDNGSETQKIAVENGLTKTRHYH